jgi:hypothetical protein
VRRGLVATTPHKHTQILGKAPDTVVAAIEAVVRRSATRRAEGTVTPES